MSGCIRTCPRCGKGHMKGVNCMLFSKHMKQAGIVDLAVPKISSGIKVSGLICGRCGYVSDW